MVRIPSIIVATLAISTLGVATAQRVPTLPGAWPLTGQPSVADNSPLPDRSIEIPRAERGGLIPGVDVSAGYLFEGQDPTVRRDTESIRPGDRTVPREANDQARAVPGVTLTVPLGR